MSLNNSYREEPWGREGLLASSGTDFIGECLELATHGLEQRSGEVSWSQGKYICSVKDLLLKARDLEREPRGLQPKSEAFAEEKMAS